MEDWIRSIPDYRCGRKTRHDHADILLCCVLAFLAGASSLRRMVSWCRRQEEKLKKYISLAGGIPSLSTVSRTLGGIDIVILSMSFIGWACGIVNTQGTHLAIDGKGLRAAADKIKDGKTPYNLNVIDVKTKLAVAQLAIKEKTNEMTAIPELFEILEIRDSTITIDAIGTTNTIMDSICSKGGHFLLQVKKNCPQLYADILALFEGLKEEKAADKELFAETYAGKHSEWSTLENNRGRTEYRNAQAYHDEEVIGTLQKERPHIGSIGYLEQVRIKKIKGKDGTDETPGLEEFLKNGSPKQPKPDTGDEADSDIMKIGMISDKKLDAEQMAGYKRAHWAIENSLHYILDDVLREDRSTIKKGKSCASVLRLMAYNIVRLIEMDRAEPSASFVGLFDEIREDWEKVTPYVFRPVQAI